MSVRVIGTCSLCGGAVTVPTVFHSTIPPTPTCSGCGATPKSGHGPVVEMEKPRQPRTEMRIRTIWRLG